MASLIAEGRHTWTLRIHRKIHDSSTTRWGGNSDVRLPRHDSSTIRTLRNPEVRHGKAMVPSEDLVLVPSVILLPVLCAW